VTSSSRRPKPGVSAFEMLVDTTSTPREAAVRPERAFDRAEVMDMAYRLMLVVSCSISSTVWMTLAFDE
jgi:hypothetical protein